MHLSNNHYIKYKLLLTVGMATGRVWSNPNPTSFRITPTQGEFYIGKSEHYPPVSLLGPESAPPQPGVIIEYCKSIKGKKYYIRVESS